MSEGLNLLEAAQRGIASPASFARVASQGRWQLAPHLAVLNYYALLAFSGQVQRLMVFMPPRHGKSEFLSHYVPAWWLGCRPHDRVLLASYEADFANNWGRLARNTLEEHGHLFGVHVATDSRATNRWDINGTRGGMVTAGVGGPLTGRGGHLLLLDDPIKNDAQANSPTYREAAWQWWRATYRTRLQKNGVMIHVQTRWHEDDLAGRILNQAADTGEAWTVVNMPAVAEEAEEDVLGWTRQPGQPLWPEQYDEDALAALKSDVGSYWWAALYQQRPQPLGGGIFRRQWFRYWHGSQENAYTLMKPEGPELVPMARCRRFLTVDVAASTKTSADFTVVAAWAVTPNRDLVLLDIIRERMEGPDQPALIRNAFQKWKASQIKVESVAYQLSLIQTLRRAGLPVVELKADKDKVSRALVAAARFEGGGIYLPQFAPWLGDYEAELLAFDRGDHDDQVDATAYAALDVANAPMTQLVSW